MPTNLAVMAGAVVVLALQPAGQARAGDAAFGEYLSGECVTCHSPVGADKGIPSIVGWPTDQFAAVMSSYRDKTRDNEIMQTIAGRLTKEEVEALAAYFATIKPSRCQLIGMC